MKMYVVDGGAQRDIINCLWHCYFGIIYLNISTLVIVFGLFALTSGVILAIRAYYKQDSVGRWEVNMVLGS